MKESATPGQSGWPLATGKDSMIRFEEGLIGFSQCKDFVLKDNDRTAPFRLLQSTDVKDVAFLVLEREWVDQLYVDPPSRLDMKFSVSVAQPNQRRAQGRQVADHERATASDGVVRGVYEHAVSRHVDERQARAVDVHERFVSVVDGVVQVGVE